MKLVVIVLLAFFVVGCTTQSHQIPKGMSKNWNNGYKMGCDSGLSAAGNPYFSFTKNIDSYLDDRVYKDGWDSGFTKCKGSYDNLTR